MNDRAMPFAALSEAVEEAALLRKLMLLKGLEIIFDAKDGSDCRFFVDNEKDCWVCTIRRRSSGKPEVRREFHDWENALKWVFAEAGL